MLHYFNLIYLKFMQLVIHITTVENYLNTYFSYFIYLDKLIEEKNSL